MTNTAPPPAHEPGRSSPEDLDSLVDGQTFGKFNLNLLFWSFLALFADGFEIASLGVATPRPNSPHLLVPQTKAAYYVAQSKDDDAREPEDKADIRAKIAEAGLIGTVEVYPANHGWAVPTASAYDPAAAERALTEIGRLMTVALK